MVVARDVRHEHAHLAVIDFASVATPLPLHSNRMRPALGEAAGIKGENTIGFAQPLDHLADEHGHQGPMIPGHCADEVLDDLALDLLRENVRGHETIAQHVLSPLCPRGCHLFASSHCPVNPGCCLEPIVITIYYGM